MPHLLLLAITFALAATAHAAEGDAESLPSCCKLPGRFAALAVSTTVGPTFDYADNEVRVLAGGRLFAAYRTQGDRQPAVWPILGPDHLPMTRSFPLGPQAEGEKADHPHHQSLWFAHGDVNGHDFWHVAHDVPADERRTIEHLEFLDARPKDPSQPVLQTRNAWRVGDRTLMEDVRTLGFGVSDAAATPHRWIDFAIRLRPAGEPVTLGDTKEGTFAVRVAGAMKVDAGLGGRIVNDAGLANASAWGQPAKWVSYQGPLQVDGEDFGGIVMMSHPDSFRPRCRWHVRNYGLFAANPFGAKDFPSEGAQQGAVTLQPGDDSTLRYRVVFHSGEADRDTLEAWYAEFAASDSLVN